MTDQEKSEHRKEVYAYAGLALYWAQCLEHSLENFLCLHARVSGECVTLAQLDSFDERVEKHTLGRLLTETRKRVEFESGAEELLTTALERRNFLTHHFFKERSIDFMSKAGRDRMITELIEMRECLQHADTVATVICRALQEVLGITDEIIEQAYQRLVPKDDV
jgi:hypothetical protein